VYVCTANDAMPAEIMIVEAMAQFAGGLVFESRGFFTGVDRCEVLRAIEPGDVVTIRVELEAEFGGTFRFSGSGSIDGVDVVRGRFYLSSAQA
jgi:3-hydroxymyristoyl/3-hydroxydecanoyl-(acyl carrier protein) dehydratase